MAAQEHVLLSTEQYHRLLQKIKPRKEHIVHGNDTTEEEKHTEEKHSGKKQGHVAAETDAETVTAERSDRNSHSPPPSHVSSESSTVPTPEKPQNSKKRDAGPTHSFTVNEQHKERRANYKINKKKRSVTEKDEPRTSKINGGEKRISKEELTKKLSPPGISARKAKLARQGKNNKKKWVKLLD